MSFVPEHRRPDVATAAGELALAIVEVLGNSGLKDEELSAKALGAIREHIAQIQETPVKGVVIPGEIQESPIELTAPNIISGTLA
jgi:hypothetical protein